MSGRRQRPEDGNSPPKRHRKSSRRKESKKIEGSAKVSLLDDDKNANRENVSQPSAVLQRIAQLAQLSRRVYDQIRKSEPKRPGLQLSSLDVEVELQRSGNTEGSAAPISTSENHKPVDLHERETQAA